jgi:hypothetical protein
MDMRLLKFVKGKWFIGEDEQDGGRQLIAYPDQLAHGWAKFVGGKVVDSRIGLVTDPEFALPERAELGDTDESRWETDPYGQRKDSWVFQLYMPLEDAEGGEMVSFVGGSHGAKKAVNNLVNLYLRNVHKGRPIVHLAADSYKHKQFNRVDVPVFQVAAWTGGNSLPAYDGPSYNGPSHDDEVF